MTPIKSRLYPPPKKRGFLENKTNANSHLNIGSFKTVIEEEWNEKSEEFILKVGKSFRRRSDTIIFKKWWPYWENLLFLRLFSYFVVYFFKQKLILFYNRVVYYYT